MRDGKPKLTEEHFLLIWNVCAQSKSGARERLIELGYMEKPETALERAERLYDEWLNSKHPNSNETVICEAVDAFREAIAELTETIKYSQVG